MLKYLTARPLLCCGIICAVIAFVGYASFIGAVALGLICVGVAFLLIKSKKHLSLILCFCLCAVMAVSSVISYFKIETYKDYPKTKTNANVTLCEKTEGDGYFAGVFQINECEEIHKGVKFFGFFETNDIEVGDVLRVNMSAYATKEEYRLSNFSEGVYLTANIHDIEKTGETDFVLKAVESIKGYIKKTLFSNLGRREAATLSALIFGEKEYFDENYEIAVRRAGVSHVMVVSGMHLAVIVSFFTKFLDFFTYNRFIKAVCIFAVVLLLTLICGFTVSIQRAGITYVLFGFSLLFNRRNIPANTLGTAVVIILLFSPFTIFNIAFQLSVLSTFGILVIALPIIEYIKTNKIIKSSFLLFLLNLTLLSLSAMLLTLPVIIRVFGYVSTVSLFSNLLISNIVTITLCVGVTAILASLVSTTLAAVVLMPCDGLLKYINGVINLFGGWEFSAFTLPSYWSYVVIFIIICVFWLLLACKKRQDVLKLKKIRKKINKEGGKIDGNSV